MDKNEVSSAFEILLEELETVVTGLDDDGAQAFHARDYDRARQLSADATRLTEFRDKVNALKKEWQALFAPKAPRPKKGQRRNLGRLSHGVRTPEEAFRRPILEALVQLGGKAHRGKVLTAVAKTMKGVLNQHDMEELPYGPTREIRWRKTANWCRYSMAREGLLAEESPRGVWEITEKGRRELAAGGK